MNDLLEQFPVELFESREIFDQIVGPQLLQLLSVDQLNSILNQHLPSILSNEEKSQTFHLLLQNQLTNFGRNPMDAVYTRLKLQKLSPDLLRTLEEVRQLKARALRLEEQKLQCKLLNEVMLRRKNAFEQMLNGSGDSNPSSTGGSPTQQNKKLLNKVCNQYRNEIKVTKQEFSASSSSSDEFEGHKLISSSMFTIDLKLISSINNHFLISIFVFLLV